MSGKAVGFYWTLPVPWAGFTRLPHDLDAAAKASKTIRYQVEAIRAYAREHHLTLIREEAFLEVEPDRGTDYVLEVLRTIEAFCRTNEATLLYVDFSQVQGWRSHLPMSSWSEMAGIRTEAIWPEARMIDGQQFDPVQHFREWRDRQAGWSDGKSERVSKARIRVEALRADGLKNPAIAKALNAEGLSSATGKSWTAEMVRKLATID